jgi:hypothetical protein
MRKQWLQKQLSMNGIFITEYVGPNPVKFSASAGSYAAKLLNAYRILGGTPEFDMLLRTRDQPVFKTKGPALSQSQDSGATGGYSDIYSNGRRERGNQRFDRDLGLRVERLKYWQLESIKFKRERLEYKIKRAMDYSDQLQQEIDLIIQLLGDETIAGSVENQILEVEIQMNTSGAMNIVKGTEDLFGLSIGRVGDLAFADGVDDSKGLNQRIP